MRTADMLAIFESNLAEARNGNGTHAEPLDDDGFPKPVDFVALLAKERDVKWLVEDIWPVGRHVHLHAARKTGKSLVSLWMACEMSLGRDPFSGAAIEPVRVGYLDYEMSEDDLADRILEMGYAPESLNESLRYFLTPIIPKLDTYDGGQRLIQLLSRYGVQALIIDTLSRAVVGDENSNDTYIHFYGHTGMLLKAAGIAMLRLDHEGHETGRSRGASSKADDVDIVWQLRETDSGLEFVRKAARQSWIPETVVVAQSLEPALSYRKGMEAWPAGTAEKAKELDAVGAPVDVSKRKATELLRDAGYAAGRASVLLAAMKYRRTSFPVVVPVKREPR